MTVQCDGSYECGADAHEHGCFSDDPCVHEERTLRGTWTDPQIIDDPRIDHEDALVRRAAESLHGNESMHLHLYISSPVCPYCALRATRVVRMVCHALSSTNRQVAS